MSENVIIRRALCLVLILWASSLGGCGTVMNLVGADDKVPIGECFGGVKVDHRHMNPGATPEHSYCTRLLYQTDQIFLSLIADFLLLPLTVPITGVRVALGGESFGVGMPKD